MPELTMAHDESNNDERMYSANDCHDTQHNNTRTRLLRVTALNTVELSVVASKGYFAEGGARKKWCTLNAK